MIAPFGIGDKVVCVRPLRSGSPSARDFSSLPRECVVYCVRGLFPPDATEENEWGVYIVGILGRKYANGERPFFASRFRKLRNQEAEEVGSLYEIIAPLLSEVQRQHVKEQFEAKRNRPA